MIGLVGGDEFRPGCEEMDNAILKATGEKRPSLLVIPMAAAGQNPSKAAANGVDYFNALGADASALMVLDGKDANDETLLSPVDAADVLYFTGGDPAHLLETLQGSVLLGRVERALERGAVVAGSSAGAMVMGPWMRFREWRRALGIAPDVVTLPHHERSEHDKVAEELAGSAPPGVTVMGIDAGTCLFGSPGKWRVLGVGSVTAYRDGRWSRYGTGEVVNTD